MTNAEQWAVFFEYLTDPEKRAKIIEIANKEEGIAMAVKTMKGFTQKELDYIRESYRIKCDLDYQDEVVTAKRKALRDGRREGRKKGREEGRNEANIENARKMKTMGFLVEQIQAVTGLSTETIIQL
jgi:predicted transposase/invertase (TIGR01784 family)